MLVDKSGPGPPPCECYKCVDEPSHTLRCYFCKICFFKVEEDAGEYNIMDTNGLDMPQCMPGTVVWLCPTCSLKSIADVGFCQPETEADIVQIHDSTETKLQDETPPKWFQNCFEEILTKISDLDLKLSTDVEILASEVNTLMVSQAPASPVRKRPKTASVWDNNVSIPLRLEDNRMLDTPLVSLSDRIDKSQLPKKVKVNVKCPDTTSRTTLLKSISKNFENFPNFLSNLKSDCSVDILVDSFEKAHLAKETLESKLKNISVSNPFSMNSKLFNISSIPYEVSKEDIIKSLIKDNPTYNFIPDSKSDFTVYAQENPNCRLSVKRVVQCRSGMYRIITEITEPLAALLENKKLIVEHTVCKLYQITKHNMCFKCLQPGHLAKDCTNSAVCSRCSKEHSFQECKSDSVKCIFCVRKNRTDVSHPAYSCPHTHNS